MIPEYYKKNIHWVYLAVFCIPVIAVYLLYGFNMYAWRNSTDYGWTTMQDSGPHIVAEVFDLGEKAGLRTGDTIKAINGQNYDTFDDLYFKVRHNRPGNKNVYTVDRDDKLSNISITNGQIGFTRVLKRCGPLFFIGFIYVIIGILVFMMKPKALESWIFLVMTGVIGIKLSYAARVDLFHPLWLFDYRLFIDCLLPAPFIHFAMVFPKKRTILLKIPWLWVIPYLLSVILFMLFQFSGVQAWEEAPVLDLLNLLYILLGILVFLITTLWNLIKTTSVVVRLQSQVIFLGILLAFLVPTIDGFLRAYWNLYFFPDPTINFAVFLSIFPMSIGYTIVKHDLFAIDVIVRRTYGYLLSTSAIILVYALIVSSLNLVTQTAEFSKSPVFSIIFALGVVFFFRPIHERIQKIIDRLFYRQKYDYRQTIKAISEKMIHILDPEQIYSTLLGSIVNEMSLENGVLILPSPDPQMNFYQVRLVEGNADPEVQEEKINRDDELAVMLAEKNEIILKHQIELNPAYEEQKENLQRSFDSLESEMMLPLTYQDDIRGIISLGRKKSGKMFLQEDLDLIKTITNQTAIALENAKLFEENIEKTRMEEELKIAHDIQISMLPEESPDIEGFAISASSYPAREVGGDFYDFIEIGRDNNRKLGIVVGDVSGKAVSGALVMAASRSIFRVLADPDISVRDMVLLGNRRLKHDVKKGMFVALVYALLDPIEKKMTIVNAGQTQPIVCSVQEEKPTYIDSEGDRFPLGIIEDCDYQESTVSLKSGDAVVFYTDGIVEAMNESGDMYGFDRFIEVIEENKSLDSEEFLSRLMSDVTRFVGDAEQHDDLTIVIVKVE